MTNTNSTIAKLAAKNKETHAKRFAVEIDGKIYGLQARANLVAGPKAGKVNAVKKADSVDLIAVPVDQASGFDKISATLRKVGIAGKDVLAEIQEKFLALEVNYGVVGTKENEKGEEVDVYGFASAKVDGFDAADLVTVESIKGMKENARNKAVMTFEKAPMTESVAANAEAMKAQAVKA